MKAPNNIYKNWNKICYIRRRVTSDEGDVTVDEYGNEIQNYEVPEKYILNYQPVTNDADEAVLKPYGVTLEGTVRAMMDIKHLGQLNRYDLAYLYGATPDDEEYDGQYANYRVITAIPQNMKILVYFERLTKNEEVL